MRNRFIASLPNGMAFSSGAQAPSAATPCSTARGCAQLAVSAARHHKRRRLGLVHATVRNIRYSGIRISRRIESQR